MSIFSHEVWINASQGRVFEALTTLNGLDSWWGKAIRADTEIGGLVEFNHGFGRPLQMTIIDLAQDELLVWECVTDVPDPLNPASEWLGHRFTFELETHQRNEAGVLVPLFSGEAVTILRFRQAGWYSDSRWSSFCNSSWGQTLSVRLKSHCES